MIGYLSRVLVFAAFCPALCLAQAAQDPANPPANPSPPPSASSANTAPAAKPKKVWTNEDVKSAGAVSVVGDQRNQKYTMTKHPDAATIQKYKTDLQKLQNQLGDVNKQLRALEAFAAGKPVAEGGENMGHGFNRVPVSQQTQKLLDKKKQLEEQIDDLYDSARKSGIESGELK
jgi:hypothetical protein